MNVSVQVDALLQYAEGTSTSECFSSGMMPSFNLLKERQPANVSIRDDALLPSARSCSASCNRARCSGATRGLLAADNWLLLRRRKVCKVRHDGDRPRASTYLWHRKRLELVPAAW